MSTIQPAEVKRDDYGFWTHPDYPAHWDEGTSVDEILAWVEQNNVEYRSVSFEDDAPEELQDAWSETGEADCTKWEPSMPEGDGWFMFCLFDTEDGPSCTWMRHRKEGDQS